MTGLFEELRRRNVVRVGVAYLVVGWVLLQIVDIVAEPLGLPGWLPTVVIVLLGVGFPIALLLAWAFELTPEGLKRTEDVDPTQSITPATGRKLNYVTAAALVLALGYIGWDAFRGSPARLDPNAERSIAVLPFTDMSPTGDHAWFGDGVADAVLHDLAQSGDLKVISRSSSFTFREGTDIRTVAQTLGVRFVLEGSVTRAEDRVRVIAQLIDAATDSHVWARTFDRDLDDIFAVQSEIATEIADALSVSIGGDPLEGRSNPTLGAYDLILRARAAQVDRTETGIQNSVELLEEAVRADPRSADALGELAMARLLPLYWSAATLSPARYDEFREQADSAARAALALDPANVQALLAKANLGMLSFEYEQAEALFLRALEVAPGSAEVLNWYGDLLQHWGRWDEALVMERRAVELDPLMPANHMNLGNVYDEMGNRDAAVASFRRSLELSPSLVFPRVALIVALHEQGAPARVVQQTALEDPAREDRSLHRRGIRILNGIAAGYDAETRADLVAWANETDANPARSHWVERLLLMAGERDLWATLMLAAGRQPEPWGGWDIDTDPDTLAAYPTYAAYLRTPPRDKLLKARGDWVEE
ncbi:MAG TPA: tetratricopeptide repeat protein [Longimicrobiales bacterium]|nr:tetratricopeptide repeat protein [Longimicrobiales bacterium]